MLKRFLKGGNQKEVIREKIEQRLVEGDAKSRKAIKRSIMLHLLDCVVILLAISGFAIKDPNPDSRNFGIVVCICMLSMQIGSMVEIRDRWRYGQICIEMLRERSQKNGTEHAPEA